MDRSSGAVGSANDDVDVVGSNAPVTDQQMPIVTGATADAAPPSTPPVRRSVRTAREDDRGADDADDGGSTTDQQLSLMMISSPGLPSRQKLAHGYADVLAKLEPLLAKRRKDEFSVRQLSRQLETFPAHVRKTVYPILLGVSHSDISIAGAIAVTDEDEEDRKSVV